MAVFGDRFVRFGRAQPTRYQYLLTLHESNVLALGNENQAIPMYMYDDDANEKRRSA